MPTLRLSPCGRRESRRVGWRAVTARRPHGAVASISCRRTRPAGRWKRWNMVKRVDGGTRAHVPSPPMVEGAEGPGADRRVLCVFLDAPVDDSTGSLRWRRLAQYVCSRGPATVVVSAGTAAHELSWLAAELGADVVGLDIARRGRSSRRASRRGRDRGGRGRRRAPTSAAARAAIAAHLDRRRARRHLVRRRRGVVGAAQAAAPPGRRRLIDLPSRNRRELARVAMHRLGRRITHDGGVDASVFELARDVQGGVRNRWVERHVGPRGGGRRRGQPDRGAAAGGSTACAPVSTTPAIGRAADRSVSPCRTSCSRARSCTRRTRTPPSGSPSTCCRRCASCSRRAASCSPASARTGCASFGQLHGIEVTGPLDDVGDRARRPLASSSRRSAPGRARSSR